MILLKFLKRSLLRLSFYICFLLLVPLKFVYKTLNLSRPNYLRPSLVVAVYTSPLHFFYVRNLIFRYCNIELDFHRFSPNFNKIDSLFYFIIIQRKGEKYIITDDFSQSIGFLQNLICNHYQLLLDSITFVPNISPWLFQNPLCRSFMQLTKSKIFFDDGLSGNIFKNRIFNNHYCPNRKHIFSLRYQFLQEADPTAEINLKYLTASFDDFIRYSNLVNSFDMESNRVVSGSTCIIASKNLDPSRVLNFISELRVQAKIIYQVPHPRDWKNKFVDHPCVNLIKPLSLEGWLCQNLEKFDAVFIGISSVTLFLGELKRISGSKTSIYCIKPSVNVSSQSCDLDESEEFYKIISSSSFYQLLSL